MTEQILKIVVAGNPRLVRESLCHVLSVEPDFEVVGEAEWGESVVRAVAECRPDVVLLDLTMPADDPEPLLRELLARRPTLHVILLSNDGDPCFMQRLLDLGARAYLHKNISQGMLKSTIRDLPGRTEQTVAIWLPLSGAMTWPGGGKLVGPARADPEPDCPLSGRELEVLSLAADALTNRQIAVRMGITEGTVKRHLRNVFTKLGATSRIDAVNKAGEARLLEMHRGRG